MMTKNSGAPTSTHRYTSNRITSSTVEIATGNLGNQTVKALWQGDTLVGYRFVNSSDSTTSHPKGTR